MRLISNHFAGGKLENSTIECVKQNGEKDNKPLDSIGFCYSSSQTEFSRGNEFDDGNYKNASDLDEKTYEENCDEKNIKYLFLNIKNNDSLDLMDIAESESKVSDSKYLSFQKESRVYRFTNAFNNFFEKLKLVKIDCREKKIIFEKNGKNFEMINLSTGEKQIVMRGASILKNLKKLQDGVVLIDEPENCLSPLFQIELIKLIQEAVKYYNCQFFICTHSPLILSLSNSVIYNLDLEPVISQKWEELENVKIYYDFFHSKGDKFKK